VFVRIEDGNKLGGRVSERKWLGVDEQSKGVRVYWPGKQSVTVEHNVYYDPMAPSISQNEGEEVVFESSVQQNCKNLELYCTVLHQNWNCSSSFVKIFHAVPVPVPVKCAIENCIKLVQTSTN
jgi:hypothetical protein